MASSCASSDRPFLPIDVFRLLVRLEGQRASGVDVNALERTFHLPPGYVKEDHDHNETKQQQELVLRPGPGSYEPADLWKHVRQTTSMTVPFASKTKRSSFQPTGTGTASSSVAEEAKETKARPVSQQSKVFFTSVERGLAPLSPPPPEPEPAWDPDVQALTASVTRRPHSTFAKAARDPSPLRVFKSTNGPGQYEIPRLWDAPVVGMETPPVAAFGLLTEPREMQFSPLRTGSKPSLEAWNASDHYVRHKKTVLNKNQKKQSKLKQSLSSPVLPTMTKKTEAKSDELDPFEWLRRLPYGEQRVHHLMKKSGLADNHGKPRRAMRLEAIEPTPCVEKPMDQEDEVQVQAEAQGLAQAQDPDQDPDPDHEGPAVAFTNDDDEEAAVHDERVAVSCRLPGGLVLTARIHLSMKVRRLKLFIVHRQKRFTTEEQFDLYLTNGKKLQDVEQTLEASGLKDRALVQVVPSSSSSSSSSSRAS